ncbi:hypothetical protein, partial [Leptospira sp. id769339]|uniref:hypothetical protein n=1 Tax=Leptospira sp. id769339 TaxID=2864221 RepID=UPI00214CCBDB
PSIIDNEYLSNARLDEVLFYIDAMPNDKDTARRIIERLLYRTEKELSDVMFNKFPDIVAESVLLSLDNTHNDFLKPASNWLISITGNFDWFLLNSHFRNLNSKNSIALIAKNLSVENRDVIRVGTKPWIEVVKNSNFDLAEELRGGFFTFLLCLSLKNPQSGCEYLFEYTFQYLHSQIINNSLSLEDRRILSDCLPDIYWWQQWDLALRLRLGVVRTYVENNLNRESFFRLVDNELLKEELLDIVVDTKGGKKFLKR